MSHMTRRMARKTAFCLLFSLDFAEKEEFEAAKENFFADKEDISEEDKKFILSEVNGVLENIEAIDEKIKNTVKGWTIERMNKVDLTILRLAIYEIDYVEDIPNGVSINEAVELAKEFSSDDAPGFINGVLGKFA